MEMYIMTGTTTACCTRSVLLLKLRGWSRLPSVHGRGYKEPEFSRGFDYDGGQSRSSILAHVSSRTRPFCPVLCPAFCQLVSDLFISIKCTDW